MTHDEQRIWLIKQLLAERSDAVVIGAGAGLSTSAGFIYSGERFEKYFSDFSEKYGFTDMYTGGFHVLGMEPCTQDTYDNEEMIKKMYEQQKDMRIPTELIPRCPKCGKPLTMNLRSDDKFVEDDGWKLACSRYEVFLETHKTGKVLFLELGVGYNTPVIIKYPFWKMTAQNPEATYACINFEEALCPEEIWDQAILITGDIGEVLKELKS